MTPLDRWPFPQWVLKKGKWVMVPTKLTKPAPRTKDHLAGVERNLL